MRSQVVVIKQRGFTLLELLVALSIFALVAAMAYSSLNSILQTEAQTKQYAQRTAELQMAFGRLQRDIEQAIQRPIRDEFGDTQAAFVGTEEQMMFSRDGWNNPLQQQRSQLQRVHWYLEEQQLWRGHWQVLDRAQDAQPLQREILPAVRSWRLRYMDEQQEWHTQWPLKDADNALEVADVSRNSRQQQPWLKAVECELELTDWGTVRWLFALAAPALPADKKSKQSNNEVKTSESARSARSSLRNQ